MRNTYLYKGRLKNNLLAIAAIVVLLAVITPGGQQPVMADEGGLAGLDLSGLPPKGNPKLDSALNRMVSEQGPPGDNPHMV